MSMRKNSPYHAMARDCDLFVPENGIRIRILPDAHTTHDGRERMCNSSIVQLPIIITLFSIMTHDNDL